VKALTVRQPWAELIASGAKPVENRTRPFHHRGPLAIHAGRQSDPCAVRLPFVRAALAAAGADQVFGAVIALADLIDCHPDAGCCRPWGEPGVHHLVLANVRRLPTPVLARGQLGLWAIDLEEASRG
jgi:hypothetical protein